MAYCVDVSATLRVDPGLQGPLRSLELPTCLVFQAASTPDDWQAVQEELVAAFEAAQLAAQQEVPIVFVLSSDALLGRSGPCDAMVATGLLSGMRTLATEMRKREVPVNALGVTDTTPADVTSMWVETLVRSGGGGPTGELIQLGGTQIGKALA